MLAHVSTRSARRRRVSSPVSNPVSSGRANRPPGRRVGSPLRASGSATPLVRLAGAPASPSRCWQAVMDAGRGPWAAEGPAASEASPDVSTSLRRRRGMTSSRRFRSGAGSERSERPRSSGVASSRLVLGSACRSPGLGFGSTFRAVSAAPIGRVPCRAGTARAPPSSVDGAQRSSTAASHSAARSPTRLTSAPDARLRRHRARARPNGSLPRAAANPKTRRTTGRPHCQTRRAV